MMDPFAHAEHVTGCKQTVCAGSWQASGVAVALSNVTGPHVYEYGAIPTPTVAVTLYGVRRHVLVVDGRVRRDGRVLPGRFRIGQPGRDVVVDAVPGEMGKLLLLYLAPSLLQSVAAEDSAAGPVELLDRAWDTEDTFLHLLARRLAGLPHNQPSDRLFADQMAVTLALHLLDRHAVRPRVPAGTPPLGDAALRRVAGFVRARGGLGCSLGELAGVAGLGTSQFLRRFRAATGLSPHRYVLRERVALAKELLAGTNQPAAAVALACGFSSQPHLGTAFRAATGMTPLQYRRAHGTVRS